jgi:sterol desaturase/sphingolipid hydroxylase (fatty acid hydroxylase superfamily)
MSPSIAGVFVGFLAIGAVMVVIEWLWPANRHQRLPRPGLALDIAYWAFTPLVTQTISRAGVIVGLVGLALLLGWRIDGATLLAGHGPLGRQPMWLQAVEMIVLLDFMGYWMHRLFHGRRLWRFHAIHHSSEHLDWLSSVRVHPVNDLVNRLVPAVVVVLLGFAPVALAGALPFFAFYAILLHANVDWDFGPLRRLVASPSFHRWHHTGEAEGRDKNFAGLLPVWDILFGTFHMPARVPSHFGIDDDVPTTLWGQLAWPFRRQVAPTTLSPAVEPPHIHDMRSRARK